MAPRESVDPGGSQAPKRRMGRGPAVAPEPVESWEPNYLDFYVKWGAPTLAARAAGVTLPTVKKHREASPRFDELCRQAHEEFVDGLEKKLVEMSTGKAGFLAVIARLKAERPAKYNDKLQIAGVVGHLHGAPPPEAVVGLLRELLLDARPETVKALNAENIIDAEATVIE